MKFKPDKRKDSLASIEKEVQNTNSKKDKNFRLTGWWQKYIRLEDGFAIYEVDGNWIRNNLSIMFGYGGHGFVHEFIPNQEIWVEKNYPETINGLVEGQQMSQKFFDSIVIHEITEFKEMKKGTCYWKAHQIALKKEKEIQLLKNPYIKESD